MKSRFIKYISSFVFLLLLTSSCSNTFKISYPILYFDQSEIQDINDLRLPVYRIDCHSDSLIYRLLREFIVRSREETFIMSITQHRATSKLILSDISYQRIHELANSVPLGAINFDSSLHKFVIFKCDEEAQARYIKTSEYMKLEPQYIRLPSNMIISYINEVSVLKCSFVSDLIISDVCIISNKQSSIDELIK